MPTGRLVTLAGRVRPRRRRERTDGVGSPLLPPRACYHARGRAARAAVTVAQLAEQQTKDLCPGFDPRRPGAPAPAVVHHHARPPPPTLYFLPRASRRAVVVSRKASPRWGTGVRPAIGPPARTSCRPDRGRKDASIRTPPQDHTAEHAHPGCTAHGAEPGRRLRLPALRRGAALAVPRSRQRRRLLLCLGTGADARERLRGRPPPRGWQGSMGGRPDRRGVRVGARTTTGAGHPRPGALSAHRSRRGDPAQGRRGDATRLPDRHRA